jgi:hypothetical protein
MNAEENKVWDAFCVEIEKDCAKMQLPAEFEAKIKRHLLPCVPYAYTRGFQFRRGYYDVCEGDRGSLSIILMTTSKEEARWAHLKSIASEIGLALELRNRNQTEPMWHYGIQTYDPVLGKWNENPDGWKYDLRYDGRKYWFEYCICALSKVFDVNESPMDTYIRECTDYMNRWFYDQHWGFDKLQMEFVELSNSPEHD